MSQKPVYVVDGARTPFLKARNAPGPFAASDLAVAAGRALLLRQPIAPEEFSEVILGCANPSADEVNIGRVAALRLGCGHHVPAWTVMRNCASGMQSIDSAITNIREGKSEIVLAGGVDALSRAPLLYNDRMVMFFARMASAKGFGAKASAFMSVNPKEFFMPVIGILRGLTDPNVGLLMGQTAENVAYRFGITRADMDAYSVRSHQRLVHAQDAGYFNDEIVPVFDTKGTTYVADDGVRRDSSVENLAKLKPFFDRRFGNVTAGNSSQITDGAAWVVLASEEAVNRHSLPVLGKITDVEWAALDPEQMGLGPVYACTPLLKRQQLGLNDIDAWEINEAFAAQLLGCLRAWQDPTFCRDELGLDVPLGALDESKLNVDGGAIALGHPVGASGTRIVLHVLNVLKRTGGKRGIASICIGGGQGGAMLVERT